MRYLIPILLAGALVFAGCGDTANQADSHDHDAGHATELTLNDGKKWQMDDHTRKSFAAMKETLDGAKPGDVKEMNALGSKLQDQLQELIQGCTMSGEAHNQLHVFLTQYQPAVGKLAKEEDPAKAEEALHKVEHLVAEYEKHFE